MLNEIQLLVARSGPEIQPVVSEIFFLLFAFFIGEGQAALLPEGRIGEHIIHPQTSIGHK